MFTSEHMAQQSHQHHHYINHPHAYQQPPQHHQANHAFANNQPTLSVNQQQAAGQQIFTLGQQTHQGHANQRSQPQQTQDSSIGPQFLDSSQHLVAQFNQQAVALTNGHFIDSLPVVDAGQFASVVQQRTTQLQDNSSFRTATFFQQQPTTVSQLPQPNHQQSNHQTQHHQQQLSCTGAMQAASAAAPNNNVDNLGGLTTNASGHVIIDQTTNGLLRLHNGTGVINSSDQANNVMNNSVNDVRHQPRATLSSNNNTGNRNNFTATSKLAANNSTNINSSSNNIQMSNTKSSKSKNNANKREKSESQRNSESPRRTFACPTCGKGFTEKFNMKRHMQIHSQSRPKYICNECSKSFAWKDNFIRHKKAAHGSNVQQYQV